MPRSKRGAALGGSHLPPLSAWKTRGTTGAARIFTGKAIKVKLAKMLGLDAPPALSAGASEVIRCLLHCVESQGPESLSGKFSTDCRAFGA